MNAVYDSVTIAGSCAEPSSLNRTAEVKTLSGLCSFQRLKAKRHLGHLRKWRVHNVMMGAC